LLPSWLEASLLKCEGVELGLTRVVDQKNSGERGAREPGVKPKGRGKCAKKQSPPVLINTNSCKRLLSLSLVFTSCNRCPVLPPEEKRLENGRPDQNKIENERKTKEGH
jgi:hypothetical protein